MSIPAASPLQPTPWRTCRVLANRKRLQILALLASNGAQSVSSVARHMKLAMPTASQYLRALEARGLLTCRRVSRRVEYRLADGRREGSADQLVAALRLVLGHDAGRIERVFNSATAFTHPRRVEIFRAIAKGANSFAKLQAATRISVPALQRQLEKLESRGFIAAKRGAYGTRSQADPFARALARLATR
jgi:DNA-binding transcriptional ArsR family regulator